jgi:hypothetical protein
MNQPNQIAYFCHRFGTWWNIIERPDTKDKNRREIFTIAAHQKNKLHLTADDVHQYYKENPPVRHESWYITEVGTLSM